MYLYTSLLAGLIQTWVAPFKLLPDLDQWTVPCYLVLSYERIFYSKVLLLWNDFWNCRPQLTSGVWLCVCVHVCVCETHMYLSPPPLHTPIVLLPQTQDCKSQQHISFSKKFMELCKSWNTYTTNLLRQLALLCNRIIKHHQVDLHFQS